MKRYFPPNRLGELTRSRGGKTRERAIAEAQQQIAAIHDECFEGIQESINAVEAVADMAALRSLSSDDLRAILESADKVATLAGTFGYLRLAEVATSLCGMVAEFLKTNAASLAPIRVHLRAARLFSRKDSEVPDQEAALVLAELEKVVGHFRGTNSSISESIRLPNSR